MYGGEFTPIGTGSQEYKDNSEYDDDEDEEEQDTQFDQDGNIILEDIQLEGDFEDHSYFGVLNFTFFNISFKAIEEYFQTIILSESGKNHHTCRSLISQEKLILSFVIDPIVFKLSSLQADA